MLRSFPMLPSLHLLEKVENNDNTVWFPYKNHSGTGVCSATTKVESVDWRPVVGIQRSGSGEIQLIQTHSTVEDVLEIDDRK